jgi:glycosyltransferase involved in cell wall biosynthesis
MQLSVFIPTFNGKAKVHRLLHLLRTQTDPAFTVHVLIDGSNDGTQSLQSEFPEYRFHQYANGGRAAIRNRAREHCTEGLLLFLDDDMLPESDLIIRHKAFHEANPHSIAVGNGFRNPVDARGPFAQYLTRAEQSWINANPVEFEVDHLDFAFTACNLSMPVEIFNRLQGFNETLKDGEDFEFGMRAVHAGIPVHYNRTLLAWHNDWPTLAQYIRRNSEYLAGKKVLVKMDPDFERLLRVDAGERSHSRFKQFLQRILGTAALHNTALFRMLPLRLKFLAFKSAIYQFSRA